MVLCWADDFTFIGASIKQFRTMLCEFAGVMHEHGIQLKASKCKWFANAVAWEQLGASEFSMRVDIDGHLGCKVGMSTPISHVTLHFTRSQTLEVLGACLTPEADATTAIVFALSRGFAHWIQRRRQLCRRRVLLSKRFHRYYATVGLTVLHGLEGVPLTQALLRKVLSSGRRNLKSMLNMKKRTLEPRVDFRRRQNRFLRGFMGRTGIMELAARLLAKQHGWAGHVIRLPSHHVAHSWSRVGTMEDWHLKQAIYSHLDSANVMQWRHRSKGPKTSWECNLAKVLGDQWRAAALDRKSWGANRILYINSVGDDLLGHGSQLFGVKKVTEARCPKPPLRRLSLVSLLKGLLVPWQSSAELLRPLCSSYALAFMCNLSETPKF